MAHVAAVAGLVVLMAGCGRSHDAGSRPDGGTDPDSGPATDAGDGVCCPIADFVGCSPGGDPLPAGGWAPSGAECDYTIGGWDGQPYERVIDARGCPRLQEDLDARCCGCVAPPECDGIASPSACMATEGCVPVFDDACCPSCTDGPCADCVDYDFVECQQRERACPTPSCGLVPPNLCDGSVPDCDGAYAISLDSCDIAGCVPSFPPGEGARDLSEATCVAIRAESCQAVCLALPPTCPEGTVAEADGGCHTGRCIPSWVCAP